MRAVIVDDSRLARKELKYLLDNFKTVEVIGEAQDADSAKKIIEETRPDVVFLDINMPGKSGFDLLEELEVMPKIIFTTAYDEYALKAFDYNALDYLLKPVKDTHLQSALEKLDSVTSVVGSGEKSDVKKLGEDDSVFVKDGERCWFVKVKKIRFLEIEGNYSRIYFDEFTPLVPKTLNYMEERLNPEVFFRANRQQIINLKFIEDVTPWFSGTLKIKLKGDEQEIELSRRQSAKFKELMSF